MIKLYRFITGLLLLVTCYTQAGVQIGGTRLIYDGTKKQAVMSISNPDEKPYLIQSWVNKSLTHDGDDNTFIVTPPLFRVDAKSENVIRIIHAANTLPSDRESVFWLNIKIIPTFKKTDGNQLQLTFKNRMKLFYRPAGLVGNPEDAVGKIVFSVAANRLSVSNPTPWFVSFHTVTINGHEIKDPDMIAPFSSLQFDVNATKGDAVTWSSITDYGGISPIQQTRL